VLRARKAMSDHFQPSTLSQSARLAKITGVDIHVKNDNTLRSGSYKLRGAVNKLLSLSEVERRAGVVLASSGNFAVAVSLVCKQMGVKCTAVFPTNTYATQLKTTARNGAAVVLEGDTFAAADAHARALAAGEKLVYLNAHNDADTVAGYGTLGLELLTQNPYLDAVVLPVGSGSLLAATAMVLKHVNPRIQVFGVESDVAPTLGPLLNAHGGMRGAASASGAAAAASAASMASSSAPQTPFAILQHNLTDVWQVSESQRASGILTMMEVEKSVVQGSGVGAIAALLSSPALQNRFAGKAVAAVCTGGNIESSLLARVIDKALVKSGRVARLRVIAEDTVHQLGRLTKLLADTRANLKEVEFERAFVSDASLGYTEFIFTVEIKGQEHVDEIFALLKHNGYFKLSVDTRG
jgi:threonine dehydratase